MTNGNDPIHSKIETRLDESTDRYIPMLSSHGGLTKREYFAAMAMQGYISNPVYAEAIASLEAKKGISPTAYYTNVAIESADALIDALNQEAK